MAIRKEIIERFKKWVVKDHYIKIGLEGKFVLLVLIIILVGFIMPIEYISDKESAINQEIDLICEQAWVYDCEKLEIAYPFCYSAMNEFDRKNCTFNDNLTMMQRLVKIERYQ